MGNFWKALRYRDYKRGDILTEKEKRIWQTEDRSAQGRKESWKSSEMEWLKNIKEEDKVVLVLGEHEAQSGEGASRAFLELPRGQQELFDAVSERTSHIATVIVSGRPLDLRKIAEKSEAVLLAWRPGTMGAQAIVRLLYGEQSPSGKLAVSIPWCVGQIPVSYWDMTTGHQMKEEEPENRFTSRYMDIPNKPLYPFGFGLSYTEFEITPPKIRNEENSEDRKIYVSCTVKNIGKMSGAEVVQCYIQTLHSPVVRPAKELIQFQKVFLEPGEEKKICFSIEKKELSFYDENMEIFTGVTDFRITVGNSSSREAGEVYFRM